MLSLEARHRLNLSTFDTTPLHAPPIVVDLLSDRLRDYQVAMLAEVARLMRLGYRRVLLQLPTGGGKTVCAESAISSALQQDQFAQFLVHRRELIKQTSATFASAGLPHSFVASGFPFDPTASLLLAGVQTLIRRTGLTLPPNLIIVDECHHSVSTTYAQILEAYPDAWVLGLTATPERLDGRGLREQYDVMVEGPSVAWLIENGHLSPYRFFAPPGAQDLQGQAIDAGYREDAVAELVDQPQLVGDIVEHYLRLAPDEQGLAFAANRAHSRKIVDAFKAHGIPAMHIDGDSSDAERDWFDAAFRAGDLRIGSNVALFGEGYDVPNISYLCDAAPSKSLIKVSQCWGRVLRMAPGKTRAIICDHAGNAFRHGLPDDDREWSLGGRTAREKAERLAASDAEPVRQCTVCYRVVPSIMRTCPGCDTLFPVKVREIKLTPGELAELKRADWARLAAERAEQKEREAEEKEKDRIRRKIEERQCKSYEDFRNLATERGYNNPIGWAKMKIKMKARR